MFTANGARASLQDLGLPGRLRVVILAAASAWRIGVAHKSAAGPHVDMPDLIGKPFEEGLVLQKHHRLWLSRER
jgi:hypothetical protein